MKFDDIYRIRIDYKVSDVHGKKYNLTAEVNFSDTGFVRSISFADPCDVKNPLPLNLQDNMLYCIIRTHQLLGINPGNVDTGAKVI
jgi:hypothetical protein